jgi:hypothetical protein
MAIRGELDKLRFLRELDAHRIDCRACRMPCKRRLAGRGRTARDQPGLGSPRRRQEVPGAAGDGGRVPVEVIDELAQMFDQAISGTRNKLDELLAARAKASRSAD